MKRLWFLLLALACGGGATAYTAAKPHTPALANLAPAFATTTLTTASLGADPPASLSVKAVAGQLQIVANFKAGTNNTSLLDSASYAGIAPVGHTLAATVTVDTILLPLPAVTTTGSFSLRGVNSLGVSAPVTASWTYTAPAPVVTIPPAPAGVTLAAHPSGSLLWLVIGWTPAAGATSYADTVSLNVSPWTKIGGSVKATGPDSFSVALPTVSTPYFGCVRSVNSAGSSGTACNSVTYAPPVVPPPGVPTLDSIRAKSVGFTGTAANGTLMRFAASGDMIVGTTTAKRLFCVYGFMSDGSIHRDSIPSTVPDYLTRVAACDSLGRALYNVRYSLRTLPAALRVPLKLATR